MAVAVFVVDEVDVDDHDVIVFCGCNEEIH